MHLLEIGVSIHKTWNTDQPISMAAGADESHFLNTLLGRGADVDGHTSEETTQRKFLELNYLALHSKAILGFS